MRNLIFISLLFVSALSFSQLKPGIVASSGGESTPVVTNMITNGTFDTDTDWTKQSSWTISNDSARYDDVASHHIGQTDADMASSIEVSTEYNIAFDVVTDGTAMLEFFNYAQDVTYKSQQGFTTGSHSVDFATGVSIAGGGFDIRASTGSSGPYRLDNVELKKYFLGSEMITNGTFDTDTDWTKDPRWTISDDSARYSNAADGYMYQADGDMVASIEADARYTITFDVVSPSDVANIRFDNSARTENFVGPADYASGSHEVTFTADGDDGGFSIKGDVGDSGGPFVIDNVSLKKWILD